MHNINITDFRFEFKGYGRYKVTYTSPATRKEWSMTVNDMAIIDLTKNSNNPKIKHLNSLKKICKNN